MKSFLFYTCILQKYFENVRLEFLLVLFYKFSLMTNKDETIESPYLTVVF